MRSRVLRALGSLGRVPSRVRAGSAFASGSPCGLHPNPAPHTGDHDARQAASRRTLLLAAGATPLLAACGFRLRGERTLPFDTIYLGFAPNSALGAELARSIRAGSRTRVVDDRTKAQAILEVLNEAREREVLAVNAQGRTREYQLRLRFAFRVHDGKGGEYVPPSTVAIQRDIAFNEAQVLAREAEEAVMFREMGYDLVQQVLRRLAAAQTPKPA
ncbi:MAG: LPS assembly lipoprotein LptE [Burkholderiaceae bacterium]|nr:LPS assembly lipoprotein LptE [Burkholderiaceae bacterium]